MKINKLAIAALVLMIIVCSVVRAIPGRPMGFAPQIAMTIFAGLVIRNRVWAILFPLISMFISDCIYQVLYNQELTTIQGFYSGMWINYVLFGSLIIIPLISRSKSVMNVATLSVVSPTVFFLISNFSVWITNTGLGRSLTFSGLMQTYDDALPFYWNSVLATMFFSAVFFGSYYLLKKALLKPAVA